MDRTHQPLTPATLLTGLLYDRGYRKVDVLGPLDGASRAPDYVVTIYAQGGVVAGTLRGTFLALQLQIKALPKG
jgi:hypothetical protein